MRNSHVILVGLVSAALVVSSSPASATVARDRSLPNGDISVLSSSGGSTNKEKDENFSTLTQADELNLVWSVANNADFAQTIHITVVLDGPGTERDAVFADEEVAFPAQDPEQGSFLVDGFRDFQVKRKAWPQGDYSLRVTGSGSETATAVSTFSIAY